MNNRNLKHILYHPLVLLLVIVMGCCLGASNRGASSDWKSRYADTKRVQIMERLYTVTHDKHKLIVYRSQANYAGMGGLIHHPDCPCFQKDKE